VEQPVRFPAGDVTLEGLIFIPAGAVSAGVVVCHPHPLYGGDMHNNVVAGLTAALQSAGIATVRFNFRGVGASGGRHDDGHAELQDVEAAITCLLGRIAPPTVAVAGYSFGSMVGLRAGAADPRVHRLVGIAPAVASRDFSFLSGVVKPKLLIAGDRDSHAPLPKLEALMAGLEEPKSLVIVKGADHFFWSHEEAVASAASSFLSSPV